METDQKSKRKPFLRLVVNAEDRRGGEVATQEHDAAQLEMFGQPNAIYYAAVRDLALDDVKHLIEHYRFHHIVDLREVPYLNFGHSSRDAFFRYLQERAVDYLSLFSFASLHRKTSVYDLFNEGLGEPRGLGNELSEWIAHGPTLILISKDRENDVVANSFSRFLAESKISYSEIAS